MEIDKQIEKQKILRSFGFYCTGVFLAWSAFVALFNLQSSINVEDGLGTNTLGVSYFISISFAVFVAPIVVQKFGAKRCVVLGDAAMLFFFLANIYPTYYTLLPAGIVMTVLQSPQWPSMSLMNTLFAKQFSKISKKSEDTLVILFSGYFFTSFQASQVFGNLLSYVILYGIDQIDDENSQNTSLINTTVIDYSMCGSVDCQNETIVNETITNYKPVNRVSLYILICVATVIEFSATLIHGFLLPNEDDFKNKSREYSESNMVENNSSHKDSDNTMDTILKEERDIKSDKDIPTGICHVAFQTGRLLLHHVANAKFLLLISITLYNGLSMSFAFSELTRAYTSCSMGVQWVGICMAIYGVSDAVLSWIVGKFGRKISRIQCYMFALIVECANYIYCLFWEAGPHTLVSIFAIFFMFGFSDGIFQTIINVTHMDFFEDRKTASAAWNVLIVIGFSMGFVLSTVFCVSTRIYFNMGFLLVGCTLLVISDIHHRKHKEAIKDEIDLQVKPHSSN